MKLLNFKKYSNSILRTTVLFLLLSISSSFNSFSQQLAFPSAKGAGAYATGGRGFPVYQVTNLNDSGIGSLRQAIVDADNNGGGNIVFTVSGIINLTGNLQTSFSNVSIWGQTAPVGGIAISSNTIDGSQTVGTVNGASSDNNIIRYITVRTNVSTGPADSHDTFVMSDGSNYIIDHCSFSGGTDELANHGNSNLLNRDNITWQRNLFAEGKKGMLMGASGSIKNGENYSVLQNIWYHISHRFPNFHTTANGRADLINNIIWDYGSGIGRHEGAIVINDVGNYVQYSSVAWHFLSTRGNGEDMQAGHLWDDEGLGSPSIYTNGNLLNIRNIKPGDETIGAEVTANNKLYWQANTGSNYSAGDLPTSYFTDTQHTLIGEPFTIMTAQETKIELQQDTGNNKVLDGSGNVVESIDSLDRLYLDNIIANDDSQYDPTLQAGYAHQIAWKANIGTVINTHPVGYDTDSDGMPDVWETTTFGDLTKDGTEDEDGNGYTDLEEYLNGVDGPSDSIGVESIAVTPDTAELQIPETLQLSATFNPSNATNQNGVWSSSDESIATVETNGLVTAVSEGIVTITFTSNSVNFNDSAVITVTNIVIPLESVSLNPTDVTLEIGQDSNLMLTLVPSNTTDISGIWTSSDDLIVTVDENGLITGISEGQAEITYTSNDASLSASSSITVVDTFFGIYEFYNASTDVLIQNINGDADINLADEGNEINFRSIPAGGDQNTNVESVRVDWTGPSSGTWTESGAIYAGLPNGHVGLNFEPYIVEEGTYNFTITYYSEDGGIGNIVAIDTFSLTFFDSLPVASAGSDQQICEGESTTLTASGGTNYAWNTGEITDSIEVTPNTTTNYTVTVSDDFGQSSQDTVLVTVNPAPIASAGEDQTICEGESTTLIASGGTTYLWSTGETAASIEVSPNANTTYDVEVISNNCSSTDSVTVSVNVSPVVTVNEDMYLYSGDSTILTASGADTYQWNNGETTNAIIVTSLLTTTYTVTGYLGSCEDTAQVTVTVLPELIADAGNDFEICSGETVTLNASGGVTYTWNTGDTGTSPTFSPTETTTYTLTVTDDFGGTDTDSVTVTVNQTPAVSVSEDITIMEGESITLTANGASNYLWNTGDTSNAIDMSPIITTTYTVTGYLGSCEDTAQVTVTVLAELIADAGNDVAICSGETVTLNASGGVTYTWNTGDTDASPTFSPTETTTYTVTVTDGVGNSDSDSVIVTVNQMPAVTVSEDITIMEGESITLTANGASNYLWNTGETSNAIDLSPTNTTTYTVTGYLGNCEDTAQVTVTVVSELIADAGNDVAICSGETVTLNASGGVTYTWNTGDTDASPTFSPTETTTYTVTVTDGVGNSDSDSVIVTVNQMPAVTVSEDITIMEGESITLTANGASNYLWNTGETSNAIDLSPTNTTTYTVTGYLGNCEDTAQVTVTVVSELIADAGNDVAICSGETVTLNASGGVTYTWNTGDTGASPTFSPTETTTYTVTVTDGFGNSDSDSVTVTVNQMPTVTVTEDITIMEGESITLTANGASTYLWNTGETSNAIDVSPTNTTTYTVTGYLGSCEDAAEVTVTVLSELMANAGSDVVICSGETVTLNASGGVTYEWSSGDRGPSVTFSPTQTTTYTVTVTDGFGNSDSDSVTVTVNDIPNITVSGNITIVEGESANLVAEGADTYRWNTGETSSSISVSPSQTTTYIVEGMTNTCSGQAQVTVTVEGEFEASAGADERVCNDSAYDVVLTANQGDSYLWSTGEITQSIVVSPLSTTTYSVTVSQGEQEDADDVTVYVDPSPNVEIANGNSIDILSGDFITLSASGANTYQWNNGATQPNIAVSPSSTTTYVVKGYIGECYDEKQVTVNVFQRVVADAGENVFICLNEMTTLTASGGEDYVWSTGEITESIDVSPLETKEYTVTVFNAMDFDEASVMVEVDANCANTPIDVEENPLDFSINMFPNPASNIVNLKLSGIKSTSRVYIYDLTGKLIKRIKFSNENENPITTVQIDISEIQKGVYFVKLINENRDITQKLIVE